MLRTKKRRRKKKKKEEEKNSSSRLVQDRMFESHHHGDDGEKIPVALDSGEAERRHISEENHGWAEANGAENLRRGRSHEMKSHMCCTTEE